MRLKTRYKVQPEIPLSSMADLAMLLLVFFVICGRASTRTIIPIEPPVSLTAEDMPRRTPVVVTVSAESEIYLDGRAVDPAELLAELEAIMSTRTDRDSRTVHVEVDRRTPWRDYVQVIQAINSVKGYVELKVKR